MPPGVLRPLMPSGDGKRSSSLGPRQLFTCLMLLGVIIPFGNKSLSAVLGNSSDASSVLRALAAWVLGRAVGVKGAPVRVAGGILTVLRLSSRDMIVRWCIYNF